MISIYNIHLMQNVKVEMGQQLARSGIPSQMTMQVNEMQGQEQ